MAIARIGPVTTVVETLATAVGAGILLGSFGMGIVGLLAGRPREMLAARALTDGYIGGASGVGAVLIDLALRLLLWWMK